MTKTDNGLLSTYLKKINMIGKIKFFDTQKGYGFITTDEGQDVFVHHRDVRLPGPINLEPGQKVDFEIGEAPNGKSTAVNVSLVK